MLDQDLARHPADTAVLVVIMTDGEENASKEFDSNKVTSLIKTKQELPNWTFVFLGADISKFHGSSIGISASNTMSYSKSNTDQLMKGISNSTTGLRSSAASGASLKSADFFAGNASDYAGVGQNLDMDLDINAQNIPNAQTTDK